MDRETWFTFFALLTVGANVATLVLWGLAIAARRGGAAAERWDEVRAALGQSGLGLGAVIAGTAMAGSLYLSEVADLLPCRLCWYQRIAMYPLAVLLTVAAVRRDWAFRPYAYVLAGIGSVIATYHYLVERFPDLESSASCDPSNPCSMTLIWKFHYVSIPFMALSAFVLVITILRSARPPDHDAAGPGVDIAGAAKEAR